MSAVTVRDLLAELAATRDRDNEARFKALLEKRVS